jgi:hypothetical protein
VWEAFNYRILNGCFLDLRKTLLSNAVIVQTVTFMEGLSRAERGASSIALHSVVRSTASTATKYVSYMHNVEFETPFTLI